MDNVPIAFRQIEFNKAEHAAVKALWLGEADRYQQQLVLKAIIHKISNANDLHYIPGSFDETAFLNGRAFVGKRLLKYLNSPVSESSEVDNNA